MVHVLVAKPININDECGDVTVLYASDDPAKLQAVAARIKALAERWNAAYYATTKAMGFWHEQNPRPEMTPPSPVHVPKKMKRSDYLKLPAVQAYEAKAKEYVAAQQSWYRLENDARNAIMAENFVVADDERGLYEKAKHLLFDYVYDVVAVETI